MRVAVILDEGLILMEAALLRVGRCLETKSFLGCRRMTWVQLSASPQDTSKAPRALGALEAFQGSTTWETKCQLGWVCEEPAGGLEYLEPEPQEGAQLQAPGPHRFPRCGLSESLGAAVSGARKVGVGDLSLKLCFRGKSSSKAGTQPPGFGGRRPAPPPKKGGSSVLVRHKELAPGFQGLEAGHREA